MQEAEAKVLTTLSGLCQGQTYLCTLRWQKSINSSPPPHLVLVSCTSVEFLFFETKIFPSHPQSPQCKSLLAALSPWLQSHAYVDILDIFK